MDVPPDGAKLSNSIEEINNGSCFVEYNCQDGCQTRFQAEKRTVIKSIDDSEFLIILLKRTIMTTNGQEINENKVESTDNIRLRYVKFLKIENYS